MGCWAEQDGVRYCFIVCPRKDCRIGVYCYDEYGAGPWDLPPEFSHLVAPLFAKHNEFVRIEPSVENAQYYAELRAQIATADTPQRDGSVLMSEVAEPQSFTNESESMSLRIEKGNTPVHFCWFCGYKLYSYVENESGRAAHGSYPCNVKLCDGTPAVVFACPSCASGKKRIPLEVYRRRLYDRSPAGETILSLKKALNLEAITNARHIEVMERAVAEIEHKYPIAEFKFWGESTRN
jgi:hypothetical protein